MDLSAPYTEGFESYTARANPDDDADPAGPWIVTEVNGTGSGKERTPSRVQVVGTDVIAPHSGSKCLKIEGGQRAGASLAWGAPPDSDVQITWWANVPASVAGATATYLRMVALRRGGRQHARGRQRPAGLRLAPGWLGR